MFDEKLLEQNKISELIKHVYGESKTYDFGDGSEPVHPVDISINNKNKLIAMLWIYELPDFPELSIYDYGSEKLYDLDKDELIDTGIVEIRLDDTPGVITVVTSHAGERVCGYDLEQNKFIW
ncbi:MAG: hypothetical protein V4812_18560 [Pseudomonadota bacterium]